MTLTVNKGAGPAEPGDGEATFSGLDSILEVVQELTNRPRFKEAPGRGTAGRFSRRRGGIPMLCLVREPLQEPVLERLKKYLDAAEPSRIASARYAFEKVERQTLAAGPEDLKPVTEYDVRLVAKVLRAIAHELADGKNDVDGRLRFRRFDLVYWLMTQSFDQEGDGDDGEQLSDRQVLHDRLLKNLRERDLVHRHTAVVAERGQDVIPSSWAKLLFLLGPYLLFRLRLSSFVPFFGTEYRWLVRQPFLAPHDPGTVIGFVERIASALVVEQTRQSTREDPEQLLCLLVNAFLEDIRRAYRRKFWRPRSARRTTYPVVLVDHISRQNGGYLLFRTINDVRNETGAFDPVVFVSGSHKVPPLALAREDATEPDGRAVPMERAVSAYRTWCRNFRSKSRKRERTAWYLPVKISTNWRDENVDEHIFLEKPRPPFWSRAIVLVAAVVLLLGTVGALGYAHSRAHCGMFQLERNFSTLQTFDDGTLDGQCIGVSDQPIPLMGQAVAGQNDEADVQRFIEVEEKIVAQNAEVAALHKAVPARPYMTLIYFATFSAQRVTLSSEQESLMGVAARQREALDSGQEPLVRVLFANGGNHMQGGALVARVIGNLAADDPSIVGVLGLSESRQETFTAIGAVGDAGVPMIAATLSADQLPGRSPLYFQVSPQNSREAEAAVRFLKSGASGPPLRKIKVVHSDDRSDIYSENLTDVATKSFEKNGFEVTSRPYTPSGNLGENVQGIGEELCGTSQDEAAFFVGRPGDFATLVHAVGRCPQDVPPRILASDDVSRYVADTQLLHTNNVRFTYLSFGVGTLGCTGNNGLSKNLTLVFGDECAAGLNPSLDGHAALSYDAMSTFVNAVAPGSQPTAVNLVSKLYDTEFSGVSGIIDFKRSLVRGVPEDKFVAIMQVDPNKPNGGVTIVGYCGRPPAGEAERLKQVAVDVCP